MEREILNEAQIEMIGIMEHVHSESELQELKHMISEYYTKRAEEEMEKIWQSGEWNDQKLKDQKGKH